LISLLFHADCSSYFTGVSDDYCNGFIKYLPEVCDPVVNPVCDQTYLQSHPTVDVNLPIIQDPDPDTNLEHFYHFGYDTDYIVPRESGCTFALDFPGSFPFMGNTYSSVHVRYIVISKIYHVKL